MPIVFYRYQRYDQARGDTVRRIVPLEDEMLRSPIPEQNRINQLEDELYQLHRELRAKHTTFTAMAIRIREDELDSLRDQMRKAGR